MIERIINSIGKDCLVGNFERVFKGQNASPIYTDNPTRVWTPISIRTRTSHIKRIIKNGWARDALEIIKNSRLSNKAKIFEETIKRLGLY